MFITSISWANHCFCVSVCTLCVIAIQSLNHKVVTKPLDSTARLQAMATDAVISLIHWTATSDFSA